MFWGKDKVKEWEARLTGPAGTELCENLLCLAPNVHRLWGDCCFALQPLHLRDDESLPLPSWDLLQMQWILHRISALSGAANVPMKPWDCDSEDEGSDMGSEDVVEPY
ncbi:hypothetical protein N7501_011087 [Penicillium viridicatum]|nr:hypothetical protein N7501_011087 [Penicillium viridicatum]